LQTDRAGAQGQNVASPQFRIGSFKKIAGEKAQREAGWLLIPRPR
jgi:hypothetical protein